ncbi:MAG: hypothetical protein K0S01_526 [Herbinix sp.]|jgi:hypothetical protein|nr:hypothetical protein [Herbinix sp.]
MKLKYKKIILMTTMSTMGIGLLTLSVSQDKSKIEGNLGADTAIEASLLSDDSTSELNILSKEATTEATDLPTVTPTPTDIPTPTEWPVYDIEKSGTYPKIDDLFEDYYTAKYNRDVDKLKSILSDPSKAETEEQLQSKTEYIDDYRNIKTYTKKGVEEGTYIVYVYHEIKFTSVNTPAPGLAKFYVVTGEDKKLKIYSGDMDDDLKAYFDARNEDEDVVALIEMTNEKSEKAKDNDEDLQNFWKNIDEMANNSQDTKTAEGDSAE